MGKTIFVSHSSKQKPFVNELLHSLGYDNVCVDKYTFESGEELWEEIRKAIDKSDIFVYLISQESLSSEWVRHELSYVRDHIDEGRIIFCPFIIDNHIDIHDPSIKKWIKDRYIVDKYVNSHQIALLLKRKLRNLTWKRNPSVMVKENMFLGRDEKYGELKQRYYDKTDITKKSIIVSGLSHIGRKRMLQKFLSEFVTGGNMNDFAVIRLSPDNGLEYFLIQLNELVVEYTFDEIMELSHDKDKMKNATVNLLNKLVVLKEHIVIEDNRCIVGGNGRLVGWFLDIMKSNNLYAYLHFNIASRYTPRYDLSECFPEIVTLKLAPMDKDGMRTLFNAYAKMCGIDVSDTNRENFLSQFTGYPEQVTSVIDTINSNGLFKAKKSTEAIVKRFDSNYLPIVEEIQKDKRSFQVMLLLSCFEFIGSDDFFDLCQEDVSDVLDQLSSYSVLDVFGNDKSFISLNYALSDYLRRNKYSIDSSSKQRLHEMTKHVLTSTDNGLTNMSLRLHAVKEAIREHGDKVDEKYLVPSFVHKVIVEEYNNHKDDNVIRLSYRLINSKNHKFYDDVIRHIHYWLCCALCRKCDSRLLDEVEFFADSPYSYNFLHGFYYRCMNRPERALGYLREAVAQLSDSPEDDSFGDKAKHELVLVLSSLGDYSGALKLAEENYKHNPNNTYHMEAYFRCLIRVSSSSSTAINDLLKSMDKLYAHKTNAVFKTLKAEYEYYCKHDFDKCIEIFREALSCDYSHRDFVIKSLREICQKNDSMSLFNSLSIEYKFQHVW